MTRPPLPEESSSPVDRSGPPAPGELHPYQFPEFTGHRLAGGLEVLPVPVARAPLAMAELVVPAGAQLESVGRAGLATLTSALVDEGTTERTAVEIAAAAEGIGGHLSTAAGWNAAVLSIYGLAEALGPSLELLAEVAARPTFPEEEVERVRRQRLTDLLRRRDRPSVLASDHFAHAVYGSGTYGWPLLGTRETVSALDRDQVTAFYRAAYRFDRSTLIVAGDLPRETILAAVEEAFGAVESPGAGAEGFDAGDADAGRAEGSEILAVPSFPEEGFGQGLRIRVVDRPGAAQTELRIGHLGISRNHPDWTPMVVLNTLLGGKFTSRINLNLRERNGYTYGASSRIQSRLGPGPFMVATAVGNPVAGAAAREILGEIHRLRQEPVTAEELSDTLSYTLGLFPYTLQTLEGTVQHIEAMAIYDLPHDHYTPERYLERLEAVDRETLLRVARQHLHPGAATVVAVGPAEEIVPQLEGLAGPDGEAAQLEVVSPDL